VHNQAFNVGLSSENDRIRDLAEIVRDVVPGSEIEYAPDGRPDLGATAPASAKLGGHPKPASEVAAPQDVNGGGEALVSPPT
jgi:nucleoside-diphosphate-sugar epimerase